MKKIIRKLKSNCGSSIVEILITISIMSFVALPAYMSLLNGYRLFHNESTYQSVLSDVQLYFDQINTRIRIAGFKNTEVITTPDRLKDFGDLNLSAPNNPVHVFRVADTFYYFKNQSFYRFSNNVESLLFDNVINFLVEETDDGQIITINITVGVNNRQETIQTRVYDRY